jgi:hypothetical protein
MDLIDFRKKEKEGGWSSMAVPPRSITATRLRRARGDETTRVRRARMRGTKRGRRRSLLVAEVMAAMTTGGGGRWLTAGQRNRARGGERRGA